MQVVVQGGGRALFQPVRLSYRVEGCEWVSVESDCQRERDKKQTGEDKCKCTCTLTAGKTAELMISEDKVSEKRKNDFPSICFCPQMNKLFLYFASKTHQCGRCQK